KEHGECANTAKHSAEFEWKPSVDTDLILGSDGVVCAECGYVNSVNDVHCSGCGAMLPARGTTPLPDTANCIPESVFVSRTHPQNIGELEEALWPYSLRDGFSVDEKFDGISLLDWATYLVRSAGYYLYCFKSQDARKGKTAFTWSAMVMPPIYFLYRKVWWAAAVAMLANMTLNFPTLISSFWADSGLFGLAAAQWDSLSMVTSTILLGVNVVWGLFAAWIYRKHSAKQIEHLRAAHPDDAEYRSAIAHSGGPSLLAAIAIPVALAVLTALVSILFGIQLPTGFTL
ncbi:MAG: DUF2628 domain-containing protein, partial [Oscillospiraceae bacterium]